MAGEFCEGEFRRSADTAHDLKTPLNVAVLNLELLRLRLRKVPGEDYAKVDGHCAAIELELRRMGRIFDAFFLLSTPPKGEGDPISVDVAPICSECGNAAGVSVGTPEPAFVVRASVENPTGVRAVLQGRLEAHRR